MYSLRRSGAVFMLKISEMTYNNKAEFYKHSDRVIGSIIVFYYENFQIVEVYEKVKTALKCKKRII